VKCIILSVESSRIQALLMLGTSASWLSTWASFRMPSGCILLDTFLVVPDDAAILYGRADTGESRVAHLHAWIGSSLYEDGAWIPMHRSLLNIMDTRCNETRNYIFIEECMLTQKLHDSVMDTVDN
jgi:hypothetical protein